MPTICRSRVKHLHPSGGQVQRCLYEATSRALDPFMLHTQTVSLNAAAGNKVAGFGLFELLILRVAHDLFSVYNIRTKTGSEN